MIYKLIFKKTEIWNALYDFMKNIEQAKKYAWEQSDWIAHRNGYFSMKECVFFYHKGQAIFNPWLDLIGNPIEDPFSHYGKEKVDEFCRRIVAKKEGIMQVQQVTVDSNILEFLKMLYFGVTDNPFEAASRSAYTDMCRTIRFHGKNGDALRKSVDVLLEERIPELIDVDNSEKYTQWQYSIVIVQEDEMRMDLLTREILNQSIAEAIDATRNKICAEDEVYQQDFRSWSSLRLTPSSFLV